MKLTFIEVPAFIKQIDKLGKPESVEVYLLYKMIFSKIRNAATL
jgi:hypothetical protein